MQLYYNLWHPLGEETSSVFLKTPTNCYNYSMRGFFFVMVTYLLGFLSAIPVGAVQIEVAKRALKGHIRSALLVSAGAVLVDVLYGVVAFFGVLPFLKDQTTMAVFWLFGGVLLIYLGLTLLREATVFRDFTTMHSPLKRRTISFFTGISLAAVNPMMILWWLLGERIVTELRLVGEFTRPVVIEFLTVGALGMFSYPALLAFGLYWLKRFIPQTVIMRITLMSAILLFVLSFYLILKSVFYLL